MPSSAWLTHLDMRRDPVAVVGEARRRHHAVVGDGGARVVELHQEAGIDDHAVFGAHRLGDRLQAVVLARVVLVLAVGDDARGRRDREERLDRLGVLASAALKLSMSRCSAAWPV